MADISALVPSCLDGFRSLSDILTALDSKGGLVEDDVAEDLRPSIKNQLGRFRVWSTNLGAHRTGRSSLDYRLQDASHIRTQVINLLNGLVECLQDGASIANGTVEPWDKLELTSDDEDSDSDGPESHSPAGLTELSQIVSEATEIINCLFRLSVSIHHPAPHDRFRRSAVIDTSYFEAFDTAHIRNKFPSADQNMVNQLGKANSFRRQYFRYREEHHRKLAQGLPGNGMEPPCNDTTTVGDTTVASSLPQHLKASNSAGSGVEDFDSRSDADRTETSFALSSVPDGSRSRMPSMPEEAQHGPFECPFCYRMISVQTTKDWRKHVLGDLRPYICLYPDCPAAGQDFQRRHQWTQHVQQTHWNRFLCPFGCKDLQVDDLPALTDHLTTCHKEHGETLSPENLIRLSEQERPLDALKKCELCGEELDSFKAYTRHVGRHQEDVALFVLPNRGLDEESLSDDQNEKPEHHAFKIPDGLPPFLYSDTAVHADVDVLPPLVDALGWDYREAVPPPSQPPQDPLPVPIYPPRYDPKQDTERSQLDQEQIFKFKYRRPDGSVKERPEHNVPRTFVSSHLTLGPEFDDASLNWPNPFLASSPASPLRNGGGLELDPSPSGFIQSNNNMLFPHLDASYDTGGRMEAAASHNSGNEGIRPRSWSLENNPDDNPYEHLQPEIIHRPPAANAQDEPGGAARHEGKAKRRAREEDMEREGDKLDLHTGGKSKSRLYQCPKAYEGCFYNASNQRDIHRHLWVHHPVYARESTIPDGNIKCHFPGCEYKGRKDRVRKHMDTVHVGHHWGQPSN